MRRFRSLLIDRAEIHLPGMTVRRLALHRHLAEHATVEPHRHDWSQALLYLGGRGVQTVGSERIPIGSGSLVVVPAKVPHAFSREAGRAPLCLMIDFDLRASRRPVLAVQRLTDAELAEVRQVLVRLIDLGEVSTEALRWQGAPLVLELLTRFLRRVGWLVVPERPALALGVSTVRRLLQGLQPSESLGAVIARSGYQRDHLNRLVRRETGLSLGQFRARQRLSRARELLRRGVSVAVVAAEVGLPDPGYFSRWFRKQTGLPPTQWVVASREGGGKARPSR